MSKLGIVCEGGGTRGAYTGGFLAWCLENNLPIDYINGISAGAVAACMYVCKQPDRLNDLFTKYISDPRYMGLGALKNEGAIVGLNFFFDELEQIAPVDTKTMMENPVEFEYGLYNCEKDIVEYFDKSTVINEHELYKASCRLPGLSPIAHLRDQYYFDGGVQTMIPIKRAEELGVEYNFVVLTKPGNYVRKPEKKWQMIYLNFLYGRKFPKLLANLRRRHIEFAEEIDHIYELEKAGKGLVIRPSVDLNIGRMCKDADLLQKLWDMGYNDAEARREEIMAIVNKAKGGTNE